MVPQLLEPDPSFSPKPISISDSMARTAYKDLPPYIRDIFDEDGQEIYYTEGVHTCMYVLDSTGIVKPPTN